jgi:carboxypeptidase A inhibitor
VIHYPKSPARVAPVIVSLFVSFGFLAACGEPAEATLIVSETHALSSCDDEAGCDAESTASTAEEAAPEEGGWVSRCESDAQCAIGSCVCGVCTESCNGEPDACSGLPAGAACFGGRSLPRAALCHATTVAGICLLPCSSDDECSDGTVCALGACLPEPEESSAH